jgi:hypothetical protein
LHYSVSESSGKLSIVILNKTRQAGAVYVSTIDGDAKAGDDYDAFQDVIKFDKGQAQTHIEVGIKDDDNWEPDEDFFVQLFDPDTKEELYGQDTKTRVTIIDDDKPGQIAFATSDGIKVAPTESFVEVTIIRKNGSDGVVTVDYTTQDLGEKGHVAFSGVHYVAKSGTLEFGNQETEKKI